MMTEKLRPADELKGLRGVAEEQTALRRVATLAARGVPADELFSAVSDEVGRLFGSQTATVVRFEHEPPAIVIVGIGRGLPGAILGARSPLDRGMAVAEVYQTSRSARVDDRDWSSVGIDLRNAGQPLGLGSTVATPITVNGRVWGALTLVATQPLPLGTEARLAGFSELVSIAIASADAHEAVRLLADEQAALRRVATLVAQDVPAAEIFSAVSEEVAHLFGEDLAAVGKFDRDAAAITFVGIARRLASVEIGTRIELSDETPTGIVHKTGRPARVDRADWSKAKSPMGRLSDGLGIVSSVASPIVVEGRLWGATSALSLTKPLPPDTERRLSRFSELIATAIANAESRAELAASRRRIVAASDEARRRIERNLHDGTQQRLVTLALAVRAAEVALPSDLHKIRSELSQISAGLADAVVELQEIARGVHPANLEQSGLGSALQRLKRRSPIPVELDIAIERRLPWPLEVAAYYIASETLANAAKHAQATGIKLSLTRRDDRVILSIRDDGLGGADPTRGSGLVGLTDRVEALGGSFHVRSPSGRGTHVTAMLPLDAELFADLD